ncbi:Serine/threonine kinase mps1 [Cryptotrichosporon argae]
MPPLERDPAHAGPSYRARAPTPDRGVDPVLGRAASTARARSHAPAADNLEQLFDGDDADESFEMPEFHFDWGLAKEKRSSKEVSLSSSKGDKLDALAALSIGRPASTASAGVTPPSQAAYSANSGSAQSSASSARQSTLASVSTAGTSPLMSSPPADGEHMLSARTLGRVVSASVRGRSEDAVEEPRAMAGSSTRSHTQHFGLSVSPPPAPPAPAAPADSLNRNYFTPGLTRTINAGTSSTVRRTGMLSRFGGPARRVQPAELEEGEEGSPAASASDSRSDRGGSVERRESPLLTTASSTIRAPTPPRDVDRYELTRKDADAAHARHERWASASVLQSHVSPPLADRYHRAVRPDDQENRGGDHGRYGKSASLSDASIMDRPPPQPLRPKHSLPRTSESPERHREAGPHVQPGDKQPQREPQEPWTQPPTHAATTLRPTRPAPMQPEPRMPTQTAPNMIAAAPMAEPFAPAPPQIVNKRSFLVNGAPYERLGVLGKGGSSKVYSVLCPTNRIVYALKRVALDRADAETYQSYTNEIELLKRLRGHDRIIQLIDHQITFSQGNRPKMLMMVMECGEIDFAALLDEQRGRPLNMNFVGLYFQQMLEAVQAVHAENVVHTDLKPANFVLVKGRLKIIDFGIAKAIANDTVNIQRDQQIGTVNYMSPEAIQRMNNQKVLKLSYPSDVWSLGCILYQMIYGAPPFQHIGGGPLPKMNAIADPSHRVAFPEVAAPRPTPGPDGNNVDTSHLAVPVPPAAIEAMSSCLTYNKAARMTIPELLCHRFLLPAAAAGPRLPPGSTTITQAQMAMLVNFVLEENGLRRLSERDTTAQDLFSQLQAQNASGT